ncbi:MAG: hypothetical protein ACYCTL_13520 [Acidimicrobiales bacterium]
MTMQAGAKPSVTVGFSIPRDEVPTLEHLVTVFADGNRSAFLRKAMRRMQAAEAAMELRELQAYGVARREELGIAEDELDTRIKAFLATEQVF